MKKIINRAESFETDFMEGIELAYGDRVKVLDPDKRILLRNTPVREGKVGVVTGGGSGHLPMFLGYVGQGMLDGCAVGNVFASPPSNKMFDMIRACDHGSGVLCLYGNYGGDCMNFDMACEMADLEAIKPATVLVGDDIASAVKGAEERRRGVAGMLYAFKVAGAAAEMGKSLEEVASATKKALQNIRTMGVALTPCIVPRVGKPTFHINEDEIEIGMGIHGEPGIQIHKMMTADEIAGFMVEKLLADMPVESGEEVSVMINGLGSTPLEEQLIVYRFVAKTLMDRGIRLYMPHIGEFATSMEMAGLSVTLFRLDEELKQYLDVPASTPFYTNSYK